MDVRLRVGRNLKRLRADLGLSQEAFADQIGIHRTYVSGLERGVRNPTILLLEKIAVALGVSSKDLVG